MRQPDGGGHRSPAVRTARRLLTVLWAALAVAGVPVSGAMAASHAPTGSANAGPGTAGVRGAPGARTITVRERRVAPRPAAHARHHRGTLTHRTSPRSVQAGCAVPHAPRAARHTTPIRIGRPCHGPPSVDTAEPDPVPGRAPPASRVAA